jgi:hypothetical protein
MPVNVESVSCRSVLRIGPKPAGRPGHAACGGRCGVRRQCMRPTMAPRGTYRRCRGFNGVLVFHGWCRAYALAGSLDAQPEIAEGSELAFPPTGLFARGPIGNADGLDGSLGEVVGAIVIRGFFLGLVKLVSSCGVFWHVAFGGTLDVRKSRSRCSTIGTCRARSWLPAGWDDHQCCPGRQMPELVRA